MLFFVIVTLLWLVRPRAEVLLKRSIFAEVVAYQLIISNWKLNGLQQLFVQRWFSLKEAIQTQRTRVLMTKNQMLLFVLPTLTLNDLSDFVCFLSEVHDLISACQFLLLNLKPANKRDSRTILLINHLSVRCIIIRCNNTGDSKKGIGMHKIPI